VISDRNLTGEDGERAPPGFHFEAHRRTGMLISGPIIFGVGYLSAVIWGLAGFAGSGSSSPLYYRANNGAYLLYLIPLAGPLLGQLAVGTYGYFDSTTWLLAAASTAAQIVGLTLALLGLRSTQELVRDGQVERSSSLFGDVRVALAPGAPGAPLGMTLSLVNF
jgi:hypothetical protein